MINSWWLLLENCPTICFPTTTGSVKVCQQDELTKQLFSPSWRVTARLSTRGVLIRYDSSESRNLRNLQQNMNMVGWVVRPNGVYRSWQWCIPGAWQVPGVRCPHVSCCLWARTSVVALVPHTGHSRTSPADTRMLFMVCEWPWPLKLCCSPITRVTYIPLAFWWNMLQIIVAYINFACYYF